MEEVCLTCEYCFYDVRRDCYVCTFGKERIGEGVPIPHPERSCCTRYQRKRR